ncbi:NAD(P)-binding Rossmann-fold superfamily protein [Actinidia rufa]|uniref:NAD(P)-binding Rossmann-fold superfamily protein n=1 Tax=Actinidia rufa TaxID=165716 RepID=A0A7J0H9Z6_9ERIC|nr:NAD(P)-binding Rossmann-fold superfamily protein [Actinidia rufa]
MKHTARVMVPRESGCIISTASVAGVMGGLGPHSYTASKHALVRLTKNTACELGRKIWKGWIWVYLKGVEEVEKMEEIVRDVANLKGATLTT